MDSPQLAAGTSAPACSARVWSVLFETDGGSVHPIRVSGTNEQPISRDQAERWAEKYMRERNKANGSKWLLRIQDIYIPEQPNNGRTCDAPKETP